MKKTSRRNFGKQLTAALAAVPVSSVVLATQHPIEQREPTQKNQVEKKNEHNTPPPLYFAEGSLIIEAFTERDDWKANDHDQVNHRRKWSIVPKPYAHLPNMPPSNLYIEHVKLVDGAGEMVHRVDNDADKLSLKIKLTLQKGGADFGDCLVTVAGNHYEIEVPDTKRIKKKSGDPPSNPRRKRIRYMHESGSNADECEWVGLKIEKGGQEVYNNANLRLLPAYREMRLMIWWTNFPA
ncbi:MAG: hypothetical protein ACMG6H_12380 [Acidobacteriota bacterium]